MTRRASPWMAPAAVAVAAAFAALRTAAFVDARLRLDDARTGGSLSRPRTETATAANGGEAAVTAAARDARLARLTGIASAGDELTLDWESDLGSSLAWISLLRQRGLAARVPRLSLTSAEAASGLLRGRMSLRPGAPDIGPAALPPPVRDPFRALGISGASRTNKPMISRRRQRDDRRHQEQRAEAERRDAETARRREARRQGLEARFAVTGVATDTRGPLAFVTADRQRSSLIRVGDQVDGATVTAIDEKAGQVMLDAGESLSVVLRLGAAAAP